MNALKKFIRKTTTVTEDEADYSIVITQYRRGTYTLGNEENFHWALMVVTNVERQDGYIWQAVNQIVLIGEGQGIEVWQIDSGRDATLAKTLRCLGGVIIGRLRPDDLPTLKEV